MTIRDVAERTGYAIGTVSRALNNSPGVSEATRKYILEVVKEMGFQPNSNARQLKQRDRQGYSIIVKGTKNRLFAVIVEQMQNLLKQSNKPVSPYYVDEDADEVELALQVCHNQKPLGMLFLGGNARNFAERFAKLTCPSVLVTTRADTFGFSNLSSVSTDDVEGAERAMGHLLDAGHRQVGIIAGTDAFTPQGFSNTSYLRMNGCRNAFLRRGIPFQPEEQTVCARFSLQGGYEGASALLERLPHLTAILAMSDIMAIGALRAIHDRGLRVPDDISLIGYDGIEQAAYCIPRLTTIRQDAEQLARRSLDILLQQVEDGTIVHEIVPFQLVEGESVRSL